LSDFPLFPFIFHFGNAIALLGFLLRDQVKLRAILAVSFTLQGFYYYFVPGGPLYDPLFWKVMLTGVNVLMIVALVRDRLPYGVDADLLPLFRQFSVLTYGQFRRLVKPTQRIHGGGSAPILVHGQRSTALYYLIAGTASVHKHGKTIPIGAGNFLGEISFLTHHGATATVTLDEGADCLAWPAAELSTMLEKDAALDIAMRGLFNHDLASKVSASPLAHDPEEHHAKDDQLAET